MPKKLILQEIAAKKRQLESALAELHQQELTMTRENMDADKKKVAALLSEIATIIQPYQGTSLWQWNDFSELLATLSLPSASKPKARLIVTVDAAFIDEVKKALANTGTTGLTMKDVRAKLLDSKNTPKYGEQQLRQKLAVLVANKVLNLHKDGATNYFTLPA